MASIQSLSKRAFAFENHVYFLSEGSIRNINTDHEHGSRFDIQHFKSLCVGHGSKHDKMQALLNYADHFLQPLGEGSSRKAFLYSSKKVLKIAKNDFGLAQNQEEAQNADVGGDAEEFNKRVATKLYEKSEYFPPGLFWIIVELVNPLRGKSQSESGYTVDHNGEYVDEEEEIEDEIKFRELTGVSWSEFCTDLEELVRMCREEMDSSDEIDQTEYPDFVKAVAKFAVSNDLIMGDLVTLNHWGSTADGRVVLLDSGFSYESARHQR